MDMARPEFMMDAVSVFEEFHVTEEVIFLVVLSE
jgi:hypothetical protein